MKKIKYFLSLILLLLLPTIVNAGSISFNSPVKTSENTYKFTLTVDNINLNSIKGNISITNGKIIKITMDSSWINKTGINNSFYFYRNVPSSGSYQVATIEVAMTGNSKYIINNLDYKLNKCSTDSYGNYFGETGTIVSKSTYESTCLISKDASLKSISLSSGKLSPTFEPSLELYSATVENNVSSINFNPIVNNSKARVISGSSCSLKVGINVCKIVVSAEAGNTKTYQITVTRKNSNNNTLSTDASISNLQVHGGTLTKAFNPNIKEYDVKVSKNTTKMYFTFVTNSNKQTHTSNACNINEATKTCKLTITAEDGVTKNSYVFNIIHENASNNNNNNNNNTDNSNTNNNNNNSSNNKPSNSENNNSSNNNGSNNNSTGNNGNINVDIDVDNDNENSNNNGNNNNQTEDNNNTNVEVPKDEDQNEDELVNIPIINKEVKKDNFIKIIAVVDLVLGIVIGIIAVKICRRIKIIKGK